MKKLIIAGGGTGGHIYPGLAIGSDFSRQHWQVSWIGRAAGMEFDLVNQQGFDYHCVWAKPLRAKGVVAQINAFLTLFLAIFQSLFILYRQKPTHLMTMGGYVSVAPAIAAFILRIPIICFEQNACIGLANRLIARMATFHFSGLPCADTRFIHIGNPVRSNIKQKNVPAKEKAKNILLLGGSQGAEVINHALLEQLTAVEDIDITIVSGHKHARVSSHKWPDRVRVMAYCHDMNELYQWADIVIARSGAMTVSELLHVGVLAILMPLPTSADNHQYHNALHAKNIIGAHVIKHNKVDDVILCLKELLTVPLEEIPAIDLHGVGARIMHLIR